MKTYLIVFCSFFLLFSFNAEAQENNYQKGTIILNKKEPIEAYINIDYRNPQGFQSSITYISPEDYKIFQQLGNLKKKSKKTIKAMNVVGFDLDNGMEFRTVEYMAVGKSGDTSKKLCLEKRVNGKINVYRVYSQTTGQLSPELSSVVMDTKKEGDGHLIDYIKNNFNLLVQKESNSPQNLMAVNLMNYIGDNEKVKENYTKNHYGFRDGYTDDGSGIVNKQLEASFLRLLKDYEQTGNEQISK